MTDRTHVASTLSRATKYSRAAGTGALLTAFIGALVITSPAVQKTMGIANLTAHATPTLASATLSYGPITDMRGLETPAPTLSRTGTLTASVQPKDVLEVLGASSSEAKAALESLSETEAMGSGKMLPGQSITAHFRDDEGEDILMGVSLSPLPGTNLIASRRTDGSFFTATLHPRLRAAHYRVNGTVESSLGAAIREAGGSTAHVQRISEIFGYKGAIERGASKGDAYEIVFQSYEDERGDLVEAGEILFASFKGSGVDSSYYLYTASDTGRTDYYDASGRTAVRFIDPEPLDATRISSRFGMRKHPITGKQHMHAGVDYVAPMSAEVYAAGPGTVAAMERRAGYGRLIRIKHDNGFSTLYGHLSGYDRTLVVGKRVRQGELIGFVGNTGATTGTHLHFEIRRNGRPINPLKLRLPSGRNLSGTPIELAKFNQRKAQIDALRAEQGGSAGLSVYRP